MMMTHFPQMLVSEKTGWDEIEKSHYSARWLFRSLVLPMSLLPPVMYAFAERMYPGAIFPLSVPALTGTQLSVSGIVFYAVELLLVGYMAMIIQRVAISGDHDPGYDSAYALAAIAPVPLWLSSLALLVPSLWVAVVVGVVAWASSIALIRHGVRPLLHVAEAKVAHYVANVVTLAGIAAGIGLMIIGAMVVSLLLGSW